MELPIYIQNYEAVVNVFGYWPSFHDANVISYTGPTTDRPTVDLVLHTCEMTREVDAKGYFILRNHVLVTFRFSNVREMDLKRFDSGNILFGMAFTRESGGSSFRVELDSVMDMSGSFAAESGEVVSVVPCTSKGKAAIKEGGICNPPLNKLRFPSSTL